MLPSAAAARAGASWDAAAASALLGWTPAPGFGGLGKSFLIENLLRAGAAPPLGPPPPRALPAGPVPLQLCPAAEHVRAGGAPCGPRWAVQALSPSADGAGLPGRAPGDRDCAFRPSAPGERLSLRASSPGGWVLGARAAPGASQGASSLAGMPLRGKEGAAVGVTAPARIASVLPVPCSHAWGRGRLGVRPLR